MNTTNFKIGDSIWPIDPLNINCGNLQTQILRNEVDALRVVEVINGTVRWQSFKNGKSVDTTCCRLYLNKIKKVGSKMSLMDKLTVLAKKFLDADTKTLIKAGVLDEGLNITEEGTTFLLSQYLADNTAALAKEAKKLVDEQEEEEKESKKK